MYTKEFYITQNIGNNALSFAERQKVYGKSLKLYVPSLKKITSPDEVKLLGKDSNKITFEDFGFDEKLSTCYGLENFYEIEWEGKKMYLFDNHNHAYSFWYMARYQGLIKDNALLYHVDEHADYRDPGKYLMKPYSEDLDKVFEYVNFSKINVGNYIIPAEKEGLISKTIQIRSTADLENYMNSFSCKERDAQRAERVIKNSIIFNLDLDFFQPDLDFIDYDKKKQVVLDIAAKADVITVATSPFFIDQELALRVWKDLFYNE